MQNIRNWIENSPYSRFLGVRVDRIDETGARLRLPFREENSNPGQALHGGCAASLGAICGQGVARAALGDESGPWHTAQVQVNYLAAAIGEEIIAEAQLLRRGKEICFVSADIMTTDGKPVAKVITTVRGRMGAPAAELTTAIGDKGDADPGPMGPHIGRVPYIGHRGLTVEHMANGQARLVLPNSENNADSTGGVHEGAQFALLDTTGAMAAWGVVGPGPYKASTASIQAQFIDPAPQSDLVAYGRCVQQDNELFWVDVEVASAEDGRVTARGNVLYRIVV